MERSKHIWTGKRLNGALTEPTLAVVEDMRRISGDILVLGADEKMGHIVCVLTNKVVKRVGTHKKMVTVSRSHNPEVRKYLEENHVKMTQVDLRGLKRLENLLGVLNITYMAGRKFGTDGQERMTWGVDSVLPVFVGEEYKKSRIVVFSSGGIYPMVPLASGGCMGRGKVAPMGEYARNCLARKRILEYYSSRYGTKVFMYRLSFVVDLGYGVLADIANRIMNQTPTSAATPCFNCIWQGNAAEIGVRDLLRASNPPKIMNVTGPEVISVRKAAERIGRFSDREPIFKGEEGNDIYLNNVSQAMEQFEYPAIPADALIRQQAEWVVGGDKNLGLPTHFEEKGGRYRIEQT